MELIKSIGISSKIVFGTIIAFISVCLFGGQISVKTIAENGLYWMSILVLLSGWLGIWGHFGMEPGVWKKAHYASISIMPFTIMAAISGGFKEVTDQRIAYAWAITALVPIAMALYTLLTIKSLNKQQAERKCVKKIILGTSIVVMAISFIGIMGMILHSQITLDMKGHLPDYGVAIIALSILFILSAIPIQAHLNKK